MADGVVLGNRLLVIDHEPAVGRLVKDAAERLGFEVVITQDPSISLKTVRGWLPTVVMLALKTPGIDGIQLMHGLADDRCAAHVILMSDVDDKVMESAMRSGRDRGLKMGSVLHKPLRIKILLQLLAQVLAAQTTLLIDDLPDAIAADQLFLEYQLKLDCRRARMTGVEALVRWHHPTLGIIQPAQFVPLAEESGLVAGLTDWVVVAAAKQRAVWHADNTPLDVAVNISPKNLEDPDFPDRMYQNCQKVGVDCASMTLELTETGALHDEVESMDALTRLRLKGFRLSIDDFGTGYSSLGQLQKMPFSEVKIDQSFVIQMTEDQGCKIIVQNIIDLAQKLRLKSVAEGVEDEATLRNLIAWGCDVVQGYYLSRPVGADLIPRYISEYRLSKVVREVAKRPPSPFANPQSWHRRRTSALKGRRSKPSFASAIERT
jgi:EAL domain-containing protein (putative c-di-GMP-specific phosphodiesterase class I)/CheY-like chemotaxis protein